MDKIYETQNLTPKLNPQTIIDYYYRTDGLGGKRKT